MNASSTIPSNAPSNAPGMPPSHISIFIAVIARDLRLALRARAEAVQPFLFFILVVSLFPLGVGPEPALLQHMAPGVIWVAALLATYTALDGLLRSDLQDGTLEQFLLSPAPLPWLLLAKVVAHWASTGLPLVLAAPLLALLLNLPATALATLLWALLLGTPVLSLIGAIGVALTAGLPRSGLLLALIVMPLYVPVLVFGAGAVAAAASGFAATGQLYILAALLVLAMTLAPLAIAAGLRIALS